MSLDIDAQFSARFAKVAQWEAERDALTELWRFDGAADPAHFAISAEQLSPFLRDGGILEDEPY
jgi:hypothetical protein